MTFFKFERRRSERGLRWRVVNDDGEELAHCETYDKASGLTNDLNELKRLRVLLAVVAGGLAVSQACAILNCTPAQIKQWTDSCLAKGFK